MVRPLSLLGKGSQVTRRILAAVLFFICSVILGNFSGLYIARAQVLEMTLGERLALQLTQQRVLRENAAYRFNSQKTKGESFFPPAIIKAKKNRLKKSALNKKKFKTRISSLPICENLYLEFTVSGEISQVVTYLTLPSQGRDPPYIP